MNKFISNQSSVSQPPYHTHMHSGNGSNYLFDIDRDHRNEWWTVVGDHHHPSTTESKYIVICHTIMSIKVQICTKHSSFDKHHKCKNKGYVKISVKHLCYRIVRKKCLLVCITNSHMYINSPSPGLEKS